MDAIFNSLSNSAKRFLRYLVSALLVAALILAVTGGTALAVPGAETREDAFAELAERMEAGEDVDMSEEELAEMEEGLAEMQAAREAAAAEAIDRGYAPFQAMWVILFDDVENNRTTISIQGAIDPYTPLPVTVRFHFVEGYNLEHLEQIDFDSGEALGALDYTEEPSYLEDFENLTTYSFVLTEGHVFNAGLSIPIPLFDEEAAMGDSPLATFSFVPPNDLYGLVVGFVAPSPDRVGAGGADNVTLVGETEEGEIYGFVRENVLGGELQEYQIAFGSRADRDAALAAAAGLESEETTPSVLDWFTTTTGMVITSAIVVAIVAAGLIVVVVSRQKNAGDIDDEGDDDYDDEGDDVDGDDSDDGYDDEEAAATS